MQRQAHELTDEARWRFEQVGLRSGARGRDRLRTAGLSRSWRLAADFDSRQLH
jgi:hypothetical protein